MLNENKLDGSIPNEISKLTKLEHLFVIVIFIFLFILNLTRDLQYNELYGEIPVGLSNISKLNSV